MAIDNAQAIKWSNEKCRVIANNVMELKHNLELMDAEWVGQNVAQYFPSGGGEILDGAALDGRPINDRDTVVTMAGNVQTLIANIEDIEYSFQKISNLGFE
jgi:hypothetical protein